VAFVHRFGEAGTIGQMDCVYSYWLTRRAAGFDEGELSALRDLVPMLGLAIKSAAQVEIARTLGRVYLGRDASEQVLRERISRGVTERIKAVLWFSDLRGSTAISETIAPDEIIPFLNDYAQAAIDAIHDAGGDVLKLIGDGVLAMFTGDDMTAAKRAALRAEHRFRHNMTSLNAARTAGGRPTTSACMSARCFTATSAARTGSTSPLSVRPSTKSAASHRCAARSIANCWRRRIFRRGSMQPGGATSSPPAGLRCVASVARRISTPSIPA
jgi:class 3 adenylate cyclase